MEALDIRYQLKDLAWARRLSHIITENRKVK